MVDLATHVVTVGNYKWVLLLQCMALSKSSKNSLRGFLEFSRSRAMCTLNFIHINQISEQIVRKWLWSDSDKQSRVNHFDQIDTATIHMQDKPHYG